MSSPASKTCYMDESLSSPSSWFPWHTPLHGHCLCNKVTYTITPTSSTAAIPPAQKETYKSLFGKPYLFIYDHCGTCRRGTSSFPAAAWLIFPREWLRWTAGAGETGERYLKEFVSTDTTKEKGQDGEKCTRTFCANCGTTLTYYSAKRARGIDVVDVTVGSLSEESLKLLPSILAGDGSGSGASAGGGDGHEGCSKEERKGPHEGMGLKGLETHVWWDEGVAWAQEEMVRGWVGGGNGDGKGGDKGRERVAVFRTGALTGEKVGLGPM